MDRAGFQVAVTGFAGLAVHGGWRYLAQRLAAQAVTDLIATHAGQLLIPFDVQQCFLLGGVFLLLEWHYVIWQCIVTGGRILFQLVLSLLRLVEWLLTWSLTGVGILASWWHRARLPYYRTDRRALTCDSMAVVAAAGSPFQIGTFALVSRPPDYDEVWVAGHGPAAGELLVRTTNEDGSDWIWAVVQPVAGQMVTPTHVGRRQSSAPARDSSGPCELVVRAPKRRGEMETNRPGRHGDHQGRHPSASSTTSSGGRHLHGECRWFRGKVGAGSASRCGGTSRGTSSAQRATTCRTGGCRRGGWRWRPRGSRAGAGRKLRQRSRACQSGVESPRGGNRSAEGFIPREEGSQKGSKGVEEKEEEDQERQEQKEKEAVFFDKFVDQPFAIPIFQQRKFQYEQRVQWKAVEVARAWSRAEGELRRYGPRGWPQMEKERGSDGLRGEASRGVDGSLSGGGVCSALEGDPIAIEPAQRSLGDGLGASVHGALGDQGHQGGPHPRGDLGCGESSRDSPRLGHPMPADLGHPGCQDEGRKLGEGGGHRAGEHAEVPGQQQYAGFDKCLIKRFRQGWSHRAGLMKGTEGFGAFYTRSVGSLAYALGSRGGESPLTSEIKRMRFVLREFRVASRRHGGIGMGRSPAHVFPLPPLGGAWHPASSGGCGFEKTPCPGLLEGANLVVATLNSLYGGQFEVSSPISLTAAHHRVHDRVVSALEAMVLTDEPILSSEGLDSYLKQSEHYSGSGVVLALGVRGGVPARAADVPLHDHLKGMFPELAEQVVSPDSLLLASKRRPKRVKRGYTWLASSYPELVRRNVKAGLHCFKKPHEVARHRGVRCLAGAFAVRKDEHEDRVITDPSVNQLLDPTKLPRPKFAYIPKLRSILVPSSGVLVISKRDARHYFHRLRVGQRWRRWLCGPPISWKLSSGGSGQRFPASCSAPMGFGPSAGWAQALTDVVTTDAGLPVQQRVHPDTVVPSTMPIWGSIVDDIWAIEHVPSQLDAGVGASWMDAAESSWVSHGVEPNVKKSIDSALGQEIQGYYVHPYKHWVGVSIEKRRWLFQATIHVLRLRRVMVAVVDRLIGKHSFVHSARSVMRSLFERSYAWLEGVRAGRNKFVVLPGEVWEELAMSALLLPFCDFNLSAEWSHRVEYTDASMTGIGRAWGVAPREVVQTIARYTDHGRVYTNLALPWSLGLTTQHKCPLRKLRLPVERIKWHTAGCPWAPTHITLGEADAVTWAAEDRLRRPGDDGGRFVHPVDSAACAGCFTKGRSSSRALNKRCRRMCSICIAGGHEVFYPWVPSEENPADEPSRRWEPTQHGAVAQRSGAEQPPPSSELDLSRVGWWPQDARFFLHLCSGPRREGDLCYWIEHLGASHEINIVAIHVDPLANSTATDFFFSGDGPWGSFGWSARLALA